MNDLGVTSTRLAIACHLLDKKKPFTELQEFLNISPSINRTTVYRTLISFCKADLLYKLIDNKNRVFYGLGKKLRLHITPCEFTSKENYHLQCKTCHKIICLATKIPTLDLPAGFTMTDYNLIFTGDCKSCTHKFSKEKLKNR